MKFTVLMLVLLMGLALALQLPNATLSLRPSFAGAVLEGRITSARADELLGVWSGAGRGRLLKCAPRCTVVSTIPVSGTVLVNAHSAYRVALGGSFKPGQKLILVLKFRDQKVLNVNATVARQ
ncbi:hypothetical protein [Deinococcus sp. QL22]|uniref:hypothetical protein n=1 Tax=Deinococcus sp. QL22 TaxID=2939437 RepID=UPI00201716E7|nr:hypothetical protein [Deinococcus sp. QL22]UQN05846.1 hypothetical protein M1R55_13370 [Deinococcus sp. QL22]